LIRYLLDTDVLSLLQRKDANVTQFISTFPASELAISTITYEEQIAGRFGQIHKSKTTTEQARAYYWLWATANFLKPWTIMEFSEDSIARFESLKSQKLNVGGNDMRIAAIALEENLTVITRNVSDFSRIPNLLLLPVP
jgi:tRNA(fMet)-specific endonuclease VapC